MIILQEVIAIYQEDMLIKTKFNIPDFGKNQIKRKRLLDKLRKNENCKLITVTACAGYGKTSLISSWLAYRIKKQKVIWLTLDDEDNDEELFWSYLLMSFYRNTWVTSEMRQRSDKILCNSIPFSRLHITYLINDINELGMQMTMVLDDLGVIRNKKIIADLEFLIRNLPSNAHIVLSGREALDIGLARYKASCNVLEISGEELSFTQEETILFFKSILNINLSIEEYNKVSHIFEGWIAGMQLMALAFKESGKLAAPFFAEKELIYQYLMEEAIQGLDDNTKKFLTETSILERFCPELCDFLFEMDNSREIINKLEKSSIFLCCLDKKEGWFRYHRIFRDFLQTFIQQDEKKYFLSLYRNASVWHERRKYWKEAIHYAIKGEAFDKAVSLIEGLSSEIGYKGEAKLLHKWNQYLPKDIVENNLRLLLNSAWAYSSEGNTSKLFWCMKEIRKFKTIPMKLQVEITALHSTNIEGPQAELDAILMKSRKVLELLNPKEFLMQLICFNIGSVLLLKGSVKESLYYFEECYINSKKSGNFYLAIVSMKAIITSKIKNGQLQKAEQEICELLKELADMGGEVLPAAGLLYAQLAEIHYQRNELPKALNMAAEGVRYGELGNDVWTSGENYLVLEKIYWAMNNRKQYENIKAKALRCLEGRSFYDLSFKLECNHIQTLILEQKLALAARSISSLEETADPRLNLIYPEFVFLKAGFYTNKGNLKKAEEILLSLKKAALINDQKGILCEVQVLLSTIYEKMGSGFKALKELEAAILLAGEQGSIQFFLNEGRIMEGMLKKLINKYSTKTEQNIFIEDLLGSFEMQSVVGELSEGILSSREIEVLNMVAMGAGNEEIANKLFVSKNTVKTHLLNIYTKLGVHSRTKAVSKAEALSIITFHCMEGDS